MRIGFISIILLSIIIISGCSAQETVVPSGTHEMLGLTLPEGFNISIFTSELDSPRLMALSPDNRLFVADISGQVVILPDSDKDGKADSNTVYLDNQSSPNSLAFHDGYVYVAERDRVTRYKYTNGDESAPEGEVIINKLPTGGHFTKTIIFGPDGKLYMAMGSSCNVCVETDPRRAAVTMYNPDGTGEEVFVTGLRNAVGLAWHPETKELYATENGRDFLGDDLPPEEINVLKKGSFYGWPYAYGDKVEDFTFKQEDPAKVLSSVAPLVQIQAHSAPLGLTFYTGKQFPESFQGNLFVALHGSWNRSTPVGYKVIRIPFKDGKPGEPEDFITGFIKDGNKIGRPVGILVGSSGEMYISDDHDGKIYKVTYQLPEPPANESTEDDNSDG